MELKIAGKNIGRTETMGWEEHIVVTGSLGSDAFIGVVEHLHDTEDSWKNTGFLELHHAARFTNMLQLSQLPTGQMNSHVLNVSSALFGGPTDSSVLIPRVMLRTTYLLAHHHLTEKQAGLLREAYLSVFDVPRIEVPRIHGGR